MNKKVLKAFLLGITSITILAGIPAINAEAATLKPIRSAASLSGSGDNRVVTYTFSSDKTSVSDGRFAVEYDKKVLEYKGYESKVKFDEVDVNQNFKDGNDTGVSIAFVANEPLTVNGKFITFKFAVKKGNKDKETKLKVRVFGINNEDTAILGDSLIEDKVSLSDSTKPGAAVETLSTPKINCIYQFFLGAHVNWNLDDKVDGYIVYRSNSKDGSYIELAKLPKSNNYLDHTVQNCKTYYYKIVSYKGNGSNRIYSSESEPKSITVTKIFGFFR